MSDNLVSIILPSYNERDNLGSLLFKIRSVMEENNLNYEIIVVDDNSPDRTYEVALRFKAEGYPITLIRRPKKMGLGSAILTGFLSSTGGILVAMDADGQHSPEVIPEMVKEIESGNDIVIGSRFLGDIDTKWARKRDIMSKVATFLASFFTDVKDPMSGFFAVRRSVVEAIADWYLIGYKVLLEILVKCPECRCKEVPIHFGIRHYGRSKLGWNEVFLYLWLIANLFWWKFLRRK